jgi:glycine/D-amino acid oxidase-like deaminating enzyme/nitrite reductase/ring-hydroxylating ferredoxin subunit
MSSLWLSTNTPIPTDPFEPGAHYDTVVVGAGLTGLVSALLLARTGRRVAVIEARGVGSGTTGNTTAKVTQLQGTQLSKVRSHGYPALAQAYADSARAGFDWLVDFATGAGVPLDRRDAYTYASTPGGAAAVDHEHELARAVGLDVRLLPQAPLPFRTFRALQLRDQVQLNPLELLQALAAELRGLGGSIVEGVRVLDVRASEPVRVLTAVGDVTAGNVILATGTPILDRGLYFAKVSALRSYAQSFEVPASVLPDGMFVGVETPTRSIRTSGSLLLTGGAGHGVGRTTSTQSHVDELTAWTQRHWVGATLTHAWSAQDYSPAHHVPFVGWLPRGRGRIYLATGYDKWGMTNGVAAALTLTADILGENTAWQKTLHHRVTMPRAVATGIGRNAAVAWWYLRGYSRAFAAPQKNPTPCEGSGVVVRSGIRPTAVSTVDGETCALSAVCSHLGAVVTWNDAERSWDCPAHGSRFAANGTVLEGPATRPLGKRSVPRPLP